MFHIALYEPEIPPNTGNIIRLCANTGCHLHLIEPLGFTLDDKQLRRAGLDYREWVNVLCHTDFTSFLQKLAATRLFGFTTKGQRFLHEVEFAPGDTLLFGPESRGLPAPILQHLGAERMIRIPMLPGNRSLNLSNTVAIASYEAWRQHRFPGAE